MKKTSLYNEHVNLKAKIVDFAGYQMPIQYSGIIQEHLAVRKSCGIFDVSHMGRFKISGRDTIPFLQHVLSNNVESLEEWKAHYTLIPNKNGGIIDDLLVYKKEYDFMLVVNATNIEKDFTRIQIL